MNFKKCLLFISLLLVICISLGAVSATTNVNMSDEGNVIDNINTISVEDISDDVVTNVAVVNQEDNGSLNLSTKDISDEDCVSDVSAKIVDTQNESVSKVSMYSDWDVYFYSDSITTRYHSNDYYYFGWSGYFDGYFEVYDEYWDCVHREYLYGYDGDRKWKTSNLDGTGTYTVEFVDYNGELLDYYTIKVVKSSSKVSCKSFTTRVGTRFTCYAYVKDKYTGNSYNGVTVTFKIAGKTYKAALKHGVAKVTFKVKGKIKKYKCKAIFSGGSNVYGSSKIFYMTIKKAKTKHIKSVTLSIKKNKYVYKYVAGYKIGVNYKYKIDKYGQYNPYWHYVLASTGDPSGKLIKVKIYYKHNGKTVKRTYKTYSMWYYYALTPGFSYKPYKAVVTYRYYR